MLDRSQDERIRREVESRLAREPAVEASRIRVIVNGGEVQLQGSIRGMGALQCAMSNAQLVQGVRLVIDLLVLERGPATVQCLAPRPAQPATTGR
jgi:osmotically-inducible protein OsmY